jgi:hypothetical protein
VEYCCSVMFCYVRVVMLCTVLYCTVLHVLLHTVLGYNRRGYVPSSSVSLTCNHHHHTTTLTFSCFCLEISSPWVGNAVGALNHKFFVLFIFYTVLSCLLSLFLFLIRAIHCAYMIDDSSGDEVGATHAPDTDSATSATTSTTLDDNQANLEDEQLNFFLRGRFLSSSHTNYAREECHGWYEHTSVLILFFVSLVFLIFTCCMLAEQIEAIETNASKIARMKMRVGQAGTELSRVTEEFNEMFGGKDKNVAWHWFLPLSVDFLRGMKKVVLGYEWDETFDPVPYDEDARATAAAAAAAAGGVDEEQGQGKIELTTTPRTGSGVPTSGGGASATSTASTATSMLKSPPPNSGLDTPSAVAAAAAAASASAGNDGSQAQPFTKKSPASAETLTKRVNSRASSKERLDVSNGTLT